MKPWLIFILFIVSAVQTYAQASNTLSKDDYEVLNCVFKKRNYPKGYLRNEIREGDFREIKDLVSKGEIRWGITYEKMYTVTQSIVFTDAEKQAFASQFKELSSFKWSEHLNKEMFGKDVTIVSADSIQNNKDELKKKYSILPPVYFSDRRFCFFYYYYQCGSLCGQGEVILLRKGENGWEIWHTVVDIDS